MTTPLASGLSLTGQVAIVSGGGGGIGSAVAGALAAAGARVFSLDRTDRGGAPGSTPVTCDVADPEQAARAVGAVADGEGRLDILVHSAGITQDRSLARMSDAEWTAVLRTNLDSAFYLLRAAAGPMRASGGGAVVLVSSINAERGKAGQANYAASKAGLIGLARSAAREWGRHLIRVNVVAPGWVDTPMTSHLAGELRQRALDDTVLGRVGTPGDVAGPVLFLCSPLSRHVTGQVLRVDGGQLIG